MKVVRGNPGRRPMTRNEPKPPGDLFEAPDWLTDRQKERWARLIAECPPGLLKRADRDVAAAYVVHTDGVQEASEGLAQSEMLVKTQKGDAAPNPYFRIRRQEALLMLRAAAELGLTPAARTRIEMVPESGVDQDEWGDILD